MCVCVCQSVSAQGFYSFGHVEMSAYSSVPVFHCQGYQWAFWNDGAQAETCSHKHSNGSRETGHSTERESQRERQSDDDRQRERERESERHTDPDRA